jgi:uncharacterized protein
MTPQERQLVAELFDRLAALESTPRDPDAERTIADGLQRAPHAIYALVQTVLVQDEALKRAHARIQELEGQPPEAQQESRGFLDNMRDTLFGRDERRGAVPPVRPGGAGTSGVWGPPTSAPPASGWGPGMGPTGGAMGGGPIGSGGSFLGTAAASAAGVIGGAMLLNGIRSMFGPHGGGAAAFGSDAAAASPWGGSAADSDLARQAGINDIGRPARDDDVSGGRGGGDDASGGRSAGLFGGDDQDDADNGYDNDGDDSDFAGDFGGDDSDTA